MVLFLVNIGRLLARRLKRCKECNIGKLWGKLRIVMPSTQHVLSS